MHIELYVPHQIIKDRIFYIFYVKEDAFNNKEILDHKL